ncbi:MAG TPA: oligopeptide transporter, OPT family [Candidatus Polarisedimenticolia bacterium]|nr:oligopeptide transporter, OPT family [Candidatus Polarisedimenticolia bacterium]
MPRLSSTVPPIPSQAVPGTAQAEMTFLAVGAGVVLGIVFGVANAYLGLRVGMTVSASIPAAVMAVALFRMAGSRGTILEANLAQTIGSASTSLASGTIFTIPALFLWGMAPPYLQVTALCFLGGVLGIAAMIPLRRLLIVQAHDELPYPEGTACAEVLRATAGGASGGVWIVRGMLAGAAVKLAIGMLFLAPDELALQLPVLPKAILAMEVAPALVAVGFILGYRQSAVLVAGSIVSSLVLIPLLAWIGPSLAGPLAPETAMRLPDMSAGQIWSRYVRYIGAGAVAAAGLLTVLRSLPTMAGAVAAVARGLRRRPAGGGRAGSAGSAGEAGAGAGADADAERRDRDLPGSFVVGGVALVVLAGAFVPGVFAGGMGPLQRAVCAAGVAVFGVLFVAVAARIVGIVGVSSQPTSGITLVTLLGVASIFAAAGWDHPGARAAVLTVGTIVAVAASKAGDISQDLKTGFLVGATPARQQLGQLVGAAFACWAVAGTVILLGSTYTFGSQELAAPQATLMKTIIEGVLAGQLPWDLVLTGVGISLSAMLCGVSGLAFAIGVYLPLASMSAIYLGGCLRGWSGRGMPSSSAQRGDPGILAASGLVAGEGLAGVLVALMVGAGMVPQSMDPRLGGVPGELAAAGIVAAVAAFLFAAGRSARRPSGSPA